MNQTVNTRGAAAHLVFSVEMKRKGLIPGYPGLMHALALAQVGRAPEVQPAGPAPHQQASPASEPQVLVSLAGSPRPTGPGGQPGRSARAMESLTLQNLSWQLQSGRWAGHCEADGNSACLLFTEDDFSRNTYPGLRN